MTIEAPPAKTTIDVPRADAGSSPAGGLLQNLRYDAPAGLVVSLVALPLCLGIAIASGAPPISGLIAGIAGGLVIPLVSRAELSVSGPAAGLAAVVLAAISTLGSFEVFTMAVVLAGLLQVAFGAIKAGRLAAYVPSSVVQGMLSAIGVLLILKQIPHAVGFDAEAFGSEAFVSGGVTTFGRLELAAKAVHPGAILVAAIGLVLLVVWEKVPALKKINWLPGPLVAVAVGTALHAFFGASNPTLGLSADHLVNLPDEGLIGGLRAPAFSALLRVDVWSVAVTIAIVASLETLLNVEAVDKLDPLGRRSPSNRELVAQGFGNTASGLLGGLPVTSVIVRSSANVNAGGRTRMSAFIHGVLLAGAVIGAASLLEQIPLAVLAAVLLVTGYKLAKPAVFLAMWKKGYANFVPFIATILGVVLTDLLRGVAIGLVVSLIFAIRMTADRVVESENEEGSYVVRLKSAVPFWARGRVVSLLEQVPERSKVLVDAERATFVDPDVRAAVRSFADGAGRRQIAVETRGL